MTKVGIIRYLGNVGSIRAALNRLNVEHGLIERPNDFNNFTHIILPGVGSFRRGMELLEENALKGVLTSCTKPVLGICLGMQLMMQEGTEGGPTEGLGIIPGHVSKLPLDRLPVMGWSNVTDGKVYYFVHSYYVVTNPDFVSTWNTVDGVSYPAEIRYKNFRGVQYHPERSNFTGLEYLRNWINETK